MSTARFALVCTIIVVLLFSLSALVAGAVALAVMGGLLAFLKDHRRLYFQLSRKSLFTYVAYPFTALIMVWSTICAIPRIGQLIPWSWQLPDPFPAAYWLYFALGSLFLLWAMKPKDPNAHSMNFTGGVFWEQASLLKQTPRMILDSLKRAATAFTQDHWLKGVAGVVLLVISIPVDIVALTAGTLALYWLALLWAGMSAMVVIPLWLVFKTLHRRGFCKHCLSCGAGHPISGPGPMGFFRVHCMCGHKINIWRKDEETALSRESPNTPRWSQRPMQPGTLPLLIMGMVVTLLMVSRAYGLWTGPIRTVPWSGDRTNEEAASTASKAPRGHRSAQVTKERNR